MTRRVFVVVALGVVATVCAASLSVVTPPSAGAATTSGPGAITAGAFGDAVGVDVHLGLPGLSYADFPRVETLLVHLGVHHVRTALPRSPTPRFYGEVKDLAARGIRTDLILGSAGAPKGGSASLTPVATEIARIDANGLAPALDAIEGPNEWDSRGGATWATQVRNYQIQLYHSVKSDSQLQAIPVIGPSVANIDDASELGDLSGSLDYGNIHPYPRGDQPLSRLQTQQAGEHPVSGSKPVMATEAGYQTAVNGSGLQPPVSPATQAVYLSWLYPAFASAHVARTYVYELLDDRKDPTLSVEESNFGIVTASGVSKPAYPAIQNLLAVTGAATPSSAIDTSDDPVHLSSGTDAPSHLIVRRADGAWVVLLWTAAVVASDLKTLHALPAGTASTELSAPGYVATIYRPALQAKALRTFAAGSTVTGTVGPDLAVVVFGRRAPSGATLVPASSSSSVNAFASSYQTVPAITSSSDAGIVIGATVLIVLVIVAVVLVLIRRRRSGNGGAEST